jgi:stearoyl-CoA desaturase (Delta-9 desaturase)
MQSSLSPVEAAVASGWRRSFFYWHSIPFWGVHVAAIVGVAMLGWSWTGLLLAVALYLPRIFFVTAGYHRYFSHRAYKTSRWFQFVLALGATATSQKGVLWWAAHHRNHHKDSDTVNDLHAPRHGFWWSHIGWILHPGFEATETSRVKDLARYPELRWLNRYWIVPVLATAVLTYAIGGVWALVWGYFVCQVFTWHGTFTINSLTHVFGKRRYATDDDSKNHWLLALLTFGEGWHNNHHHYQSSARQGFLWWQIDISWYILRGLAAVGLVWDLRGVPDHIVSAPHAREAITIPSECASLPPSSSSGAPS